MLREAPAKKAQRNSPWFDPKQPVRVRQVFLGSQKIISGIVPFETIIPTEDWILKSRFEKANLHGYVTSIVTSCISSLVGRVFGAVFSYFVVGRSIENTFVIRA